MAGNSLRVGNGEYAKGVAEAVIGAGSMTAGGAYALNQTVNNVKLHNATVQYAEAQAAWENYQNFMCLTTDNKIPSAIKIRLYERALPSKMISERLARLTPNQRVDLLGRIDKMTLQKGYGAMRLREMVTINKWSWDTAVEHVASEGLLAVTQSSPELWEVVSGASQAQFEQALFFGSDVAASRLNVRLLSDVIAPAQEQAHLEAARANSDIVATEAQITRSRIIGGVGVLFGVLALVDGLTRVKNSGRSLSQMVDQALSCNGDDPSCFSE